MTALKAVCVYCGSSVGARPDYVAGCETLADELAARDITLVYGGAHVGVMGAIADRVLARGGKAVGVIPQGLVKLEVAHEGLTELIVVKDMHERKALMADRSDGFVALPGGLGTFEELFEALTWSQLGIHAKPCAVLNIANYYDGLLQFLDHSRDEQFMKPAHRELLISENDPARMLQRMEEYELRVTSKL